MNYRHAYHAGNFADVVKHMVLIYALHHLHKKTTSFYVLDTHAGKGLYDLRAGEALRTGEAAHGVLNLEWMCSSLPLLGSLYHASIQPYLLKNLYPGSPLLISHFIRPQDRAHVIELHPQDKAVLKEIVKTNPNVTVYEQDGYQTLKAFLPPQERRGLILVDPPFEKKDEFNTLLKGIRQGLKRFAHGVYMIWYPLKDMLAAQAFYDSLECSRHMLYLLYGKKKHEQKEGLTSAGLLVINPPFGLQQALEEAAPWLDAGDITLNIHVKNAD